MPSALSTILGDTLVWDNHACMPLRPDDRRFLPMLDRLRRIGVDVVSLNVAFGDDGAGQAATMLQAFRDWIAANPATLMLVATAADADLARAEGRLGICFDLESMTALDGDIANVDRFYRLGVRWMLATYNRPNAAAGGCLAEDHGLTDYGRAVVAEMNRVGMVVCASHCGYRTARELIDRSETPVIFSHSNARAIHDHPRNIPDTLALACAARGGVIGVNGFGPFLGGGVDAYIAHVDHLLDLVGDDHVGIALDYVFDAREFEAYMAANPALFPADTYPAGAAMLEPEALPAIALALRARGRSDATLAKLFGGNHRRIAATIWR